ncbi:hypothetical protein BDP27DRAFT_1323419 [Rhodocollybia butyracea]|uniref:Uncharacterized protein n=1 Tax=Rhodocollybia butyracea TaxID=206335 RepID=A0A9P5PQW6_9AGAR|nr:hypothetical protein BDP27DRAFT_1323419 [Rhodocollybia butyracea]
MLITPHMHCVGLVLVAVLISSVHAIPTPPPETPLPSEFLHHSYLQEFKFHFGHPGTPANPIHFSDAPPHAESEALLESEVESTWTNLLSFIHGFY